MRLSKAAFLEIKRKLEKKYPRFVGKSNDVTVETSCFDPKIEFESKVDGTPVHLRITKYGYAICYPNPMGVWKAYTRY